MLTCQLTKQERGTFVVQSSAFGEDKLEKRFKAKGSRLKVQGERIVIVKAEGRWTTAALGRGTRKTDGERG